jgi:hypothetical protein
MAKISEVELLLVFWMNSTNPNYLCSANTISAPNDGAVSHIMPVLFKYRSTSASLPRYL